MDLFLTHLISFPVVVYSVLLAIILSYWLLAFLGGIDTEMFDLSFDTDIDIEGDLGADVDGSRGLSGITGFFLKFGLTGVPVTLVVSILVLFSWMICYIYVSVLSVLIPGDILKMITGAVMIFISFALAIPLASWVIKPLKKLFITHEAVSKGTLIGTECIVKTGKVTATFGQAILEHDVDGLIFDVRADEAAGIKKGDKVVLVEYIEDDSSYLIKKKLS
ncbi:OB-fold-containig protein [Marinicella rhabdoformis]|uniref:OB-fold-containig protein n=1 Tax=Marinicella rhabdoformis TaxID=2580566 RepID=UPI0012AEDCA5|nr:OB-fold-containig protein [Marinicella rhabdoformis]